MIGRTKGKFDAGLIEAGVSQIIRGLGCDVRDTNFRDTPERVARMYAEMFAVKEREWAVFDEEYSDFILLKGHTLWSICPHHLVPVEFRVNLAYVPNGQVLGLSKLARMCDETNTGPILQERFTKDLVRTLLELVPSAKGAACLVEGQHGCTKIRGVRSSAWFTTFRMEGCFRDDPSLEDRFFTLTGR